MKISFGVVFLLINFNKSVSFLNTNNLIPSKSLLKCRNINIINRKSERSNNININRCSLSGSLLGVELKKQGHIVFAFPMVGQGISYEKVGIKVHGYRKEFSTGGLGYTSFIGRLTDLFEGQLYYLFSSIIRLLFVARKYDFLIVIGDILPLLLAWLTGELGK